MRSESARATAVPGESDIIRASYCCVREITTLFLINMIRPCHNHRSPKYHAASPDKRVIKALIKKMDGGATILSNPMFFDPNLCTFF